MSRLTILVITLSSIGLLNESIAAEPNIDGLERIVVTAQKREQDIQEVPIAISTVSGNVLIAQSRRSIFDIQSQLVGFTANQSQSANNANFAIRGIGTGSQNYGFESSVGLYVDGVYRPRQNTFVNNWVDVANIEVLRGPQGTVFGKNTSAGAVLITSKLPDHQENDAYTSFSLGNFGLLTAQGAGNLHLIDDTLTLRVNGFIESRDGFIDDLSLGNNKINDRNREGIKVQALYTPSLDLSVRFIADYAHLDEVCCGALTYQDNIVATDIAGKFGTDALLSAPPFNAQPLTRESFEALESNLTFLPRSRLTERGYSAHVDWQYSELWRFTSISSYREYSSFDQVDSDFGQAALLFTVNDVEQRALSQEFQLHYSSESVSALLGAFYFDQSLDLDFGLNTDTQFGDFINLSISPLLPITDGINQLSQLTNGLIAPVAPAAVDNVSFFHEADQDFKSWAVFAQSDWSISDTLSLTTGLRYTNDEKQIAGRYEELADGFTGLPDNPALWPNPDAAVSALPEILSTLLSGGLPTTEQFQALAGFQQPGWGYFLLGTASARPRPPLNSALDDDQISGTLRLSYQPTNHSLMYASYATGYKAGGTNTDRIDPSFSAVFDAETSEAFELGLKHDFVDSKLRLNIALHLTNIEDFQASTFTGSGFNLQNAGDIESKGFEIDLRWQPRPNLSVTAGLARNLARFKEFDRGTCWVSTPWHTGLADPGASANAPYCSRNGDRVGFEPDLLGFVSATQEFTLFSIPQSVNFVLSYSGNVALDESNDPIKTASSYTLIDGNYTIYANQWNTEISLWVHNMFDQRYVARNGFDAPVQAGRVMAYPGMPRTFGLTVSTKF